MQPGQGSGRRAGSSNFMDLSVKNTVYHEMNGVDKVVERENESSTGGSRGLIS